MKNNISLTNIDKKVEDDNEGDNSSSKDNSVTMDEIEDYEEDTLSAVDYYHELDEEEVEEWKDILQMYSEGEVRDRLYSEVGFVSDSQDFIDLLKGKLKDEAKEFDDSNAKVGNMDNVNDGYFEEEEVEVEDNEVDEGQKTYSSAVEEVLDILDDLGVVPLATVGDSLSDEDLDKLRNMEGVEIDEHNIKNLNEEKYFR